MKRLIFGLAAILTASAMAAFTTPLSTEKAVAEYYFAFKYLSVTPTEENVEDPANWEKVNNMSGCASGSDMACKLRVSDIYVDSETETLLPEFIIEATEDEPDVARVVSSDADEIVNRANP